MQCEYGPGFPLTPATGGRPPRQNNTSFSLGALINRGVFTSLAFTISMLISGRWTDLALRILSVPFIKLRYKSCLRADPSEDATSPPWLVLVPVLAGGDGFSQPHFRPFFPAHNAGGGEERCRAQPDSWQLTDDPRLLNISIVAVTTSQHPPACGRYACLGKQPHGMETSLD